MSTSAMTAGSGREYVQRLACSWRAVLVLTMLLLTCGWQFSGKPNRQPMLMKEITHVAFFTSGLGPEYFEIAQRQIAATTLHFCKAQPYSVHYFVFTNQLEDASVASNSSVTFIAKQSEGWPRNLDDRFTWFGEAIRDYNIMSRFKFALWMNADNTLVEDTCEDMLGNLVAARHGGNTSAEDDFPYESNPESQAFVSSSNKFTHPYYSAHIYGGTVENFLHLSDVCAAWTLKDHAENVHAKLNTECALMTTRSYLNRYFMENHPTVTLSYAYVYPKHEKMPWSSTVKRMATCCGQ